MADYFDRITFQNQIWLFNELCSLIKTFYNHHLYHQSFPKKARFNPTEVRFTKVLTKYSTEYNNLLFIQNLCIQLSMDQKDLFAFFLTLRNQYPEDEIPRILETYDISKLDVNRIYRYLDKYMAKPEQGGVSALSSSLAGSSSSSSLAGSSSSSLAAAAADNDILDNTDLLEY